MDHLVKLSGSVPVLSLNPLGSFHDDRYYINDECLTNLNEICNKLRNEDPNTRPFRRAIGFLDVLNKDLIPILVGIKGQPEIFYSTIKLLAELTTPIEGLVCIETPKKGILKNIVVHEVEQLLYSAKEAFLDGRATLAVLRHLHHLLEQRTLSSDDNKCVKDSLALINNILHVPERPTIELSNVEAAGVEATQQQTEIISSLLHPSHSNSRSNAVGGRQSRLMWNLFGQGLDRILITLLRKSQKNDWTANIVQLMARIYEDHCVEEMEKLVDTCLLTYKEAEPDSESNGTPPLADAYNSKGFLNLPYEQPCPSDSCARLTRGLEATTIVSSTILDPVTRKMGCNKRYKVSGGTECSSTVTSSLHANRSNKSERCSQSKTSCELFSNDARCKRGNRWMTHSRKRKYLGLRPQGNTEKSDNTFKRNIAPVTLSIPQSVKQNDETHFISMKHDQEAAEELACKSRRRNRETCRFIRTKVFQHAPTKEEISHLLADFLVDFLLYGYNTLVGHLHQQLLQQRDDSSLLEEATFLWLISYFLPFISKLKLDIRRFSNVFTIDLLCFLTWEVVRHAELFELNSLQSTNGLEPFQRRLHLGVRAIWEFLQTFKLSSSVNKESTRSNETPLENCGEEFFCDLRSYLPAVRDLRQLFLLQLRHFNPTIQNRQYLCNVIATNHVLLLEIERATKQSTLVAQSFDLHQHVNQFCTETIVNRYGIALEDFRTNSSFVNDCIFTLLHHVGVDLGRPDLLCQQGVLRSFRDIWEEDDDICDDWKDLIEYVVRKFLRFHQTIGHFRMGSPINRSNNLTREQDSLPGKSEQFKTSKLSDRVKTEQSTGKNDTPATEVRSTETELLIAQLKDSGFQKQLDWIQSSLLTACSARLGSYDGQEFRHPITCLSLQMNVSCPIVPWTEVEASALCSDTFLCLLDRVGLFPCSAQGTLYPRIPREWSADTVFSVALIFGPVSQEVVDFDLSLCKQS